MIVLCVGINSKPCLFTYNEENEELSGDRGRWWPGRFSVKLLEDVRFETGGEFGMLVEEQVVLDIFLVKDHFHFGHHIP